MGGTSDTPDGDVHPGAATPRTRPSPVTRAVTAVRAHPEWLAWTGIALFALVVGRVNEPPALYDDAAITFRYAERLADGDGLTYNDHEHVMGFSNPLWTLILGAARVLGLPMIGTARALSLVLLMVSAVLAAMIARRLSNLGGGIAAGVLLVGTVVYVQQVTSGMEVGLTTTLGLAAVLAAWHRREVLTGVLLGFAVLSKFEAGLLCVPLAAGWWWAFRKPPWRMALAAVAVVAPWALFATVYYGSPIPNSFTTKLGDQYRAFDRAWVLKQADLTLGVLAVGFSALRIVRGEARDRVVVVGLTGWFVLLLVTLSLLDLGDTYPWYLTALFPPLAILAGAGLGAIGAYLARPGTITIDRRRLLAVLGVGVVLAYAVSGRVRSIAVRPTVDANKLALILVVGAIVAAIVWIRSDERRHDLLAVGAALAGVFLVGLWWAKLDYSEPFQDLARNPYQEIEVDRQLAGEATARLAEPGEVILTGWGWPAYTAIDNPVYDTSGLNLDEPPPGDVTWHTEPGTPIDQPTVPPEIPGFRVVSNITHTCRIDPRFTWYAIYVAVGTAADERSPEGLEIPEHCGPEVLEAAVAEGRVPP